MDRPCYREEGGVDGENGRVNPLARKERERLRDEARLEERTHLLFGRVAATPGIVLALAGNLTPGDLGPAGPTGFLLGALGYGLGARRLAVVAVVISVVEMFLGAFIY